MNGWTYGIVYIGKMNQPLKPQKPELHDTQLTDLNQSKRWGICTGDQTISKLEFTFTDGARKAKTR